MTRFFFDLVGPNHRSFDFHGRYFRNPKEAHDHAHMLNLDLSCTDNREWRDAKIEVRDVAGCHLFSLAITEVDELRPAA